MVMMAETHPQAPYDRVLRPVRCTQITNGKSCNTRGDADIDWSAPGQTVNWKCPRCKTLNLVRIVEAERAGPL